MNCEEVSKHLTEYLDNTLDTAMTTRVATHVISCALCRAESNELADCIQQVATLPALDAPLGFAQRIMAHVHDMEPKASLWRRLMLSLTSRVPVQATAFAVVAVCAIALYQNQQPLRQNSDVNLALRHQAATTPLDQKNLTPTAVVPTTALKDRESAAKTTATPKVPPEAQKKAESNSPRSVLSEATQSQQTKATGTTAENANPESPGEPPNIAPKRPPLRVQEVATGRESSVFGDPRGFSFPFPAPISALRSSESRPMALALERATHFGDRVADFEFTVRRRAPQRREPVENLSSADALQKSNETDTSSQGASRPASAPAAARARIESIAEIRFYNVAAEHFEIFKKDLAAEANIESEPKNTAKELDAAKQTDRQLLIKVTILPAESASNNR